jgi:hypothetical protein
LKQGKPAKESGNVEYAAASCNSSGGLCPSRTKQNIKQKNKKSIRIKTNL